MGFSAEWLALREPADVAARDGALLAAAAQAAQAAQGRSGAGVARPVIVDLGCGTGSTLRAFQPVLTTSAAWRLVDADAALLNRAAELAGPDVALHQIDLRQIDDLPLAGASLVTASALLDLCARDWVSALADRLAQLGLPFYAALSYDGVMHWTPEDPDDAAVTAAFNRHQRGDKGFGPALGPDAADVAAEVFAAAGFRVLQADSPWRLAAPEAVLHRDLIAGIAAAAAEVADPAMAATWAARRQASLADPQASVGIIGHRDLLALPAGS